MGRAARERVRDHFISVRSLLDYLAVIRTLLRTGRPSAYSASSR
jgi:hypothetical protein